MTVRCFSVFFLGTLAAQDVGVVAGSAGSGLAATATLNLLQDLQTFPPNTAFAASPFGLFASRSSSVGGAGAGITATFRSVPSPTALASASFEATGGLRANHNTISARAAGDLAFTFTSPRVVSGRMRVTFRGSIVGPGDATLRVDLGDDGSEEFVRSASQGDLEQHFAATTLPPGLRVKVTGVASGALAVMGTLGIRAWIELEFVPRMQMVPYGAACDHTLTGSYMNTPTTDTFGFRVTNGPPSMPGVLVVGDTAVDLPLPGTSCRLRAAPLVLIPIGIDANGSSYVEFTIPHIPGLNVFTQAIAPSSPALPVLKTSNGLEIR